MKVIPINVINKTPWITLIILVLISPIVLAQELSMPSGLYVLISPNKPVSQDILNSPNVAGVVLRGNWQDVTDGQGKYQLDYYHKELERAQDAGKAVSLVINNGGINTPEFVMKQVRHTLKFTDRNRFHKTYATKLTIPAFWDEKLIAEKMQLISDLAEELADYPSLKSVSIQCFNATTDDWNIPRTVEGHKARYDLDLMYEACVALIDHAARTFTRQYLKMAVGRLPFRAPGTHADSLTERLSEYIQTHHRDRVFLQRHNLSTMTPYSVRDSLRKTSDYSENDPTHADSSLVQPPNTRRTSPDESPAGLMGWKAIYDAAPFNAAQFLWPLSDTKSCRMNGGEKPCDSLEMLRKVKLISDFYNFYYVEIYGVDFDRLHDSQEFTTWAQSFRNHSSNSSRPKIRESGIRKNRSTEKSSKPRTQGIYGPWSNPPPTGAQNRLTTHFEYQSKLLGEKVGYSLYMPKGNWKKGVLPVIYWLHGKGGNENRSAQNARFLEAAINEGKIQPIAMVFLNGGLQSFYSDDKAGNVPIESAIINELIPAIESRHGIGGSSDKRLLEGFSMGGFGALKLAAKYPEMFASVSVYGGAFLSKDNPPKRRDADALEKVFANDLEYFHENTPAYWLQKNSKKIISKNLPIRIRVGSSDGTRPYNLALHESLQKLGIKHDFAVLSGVQHFPKSYYDADQLGSFQFHQAALQGK